MASAADNLLENETSDGNLQPQKKMETNDGSGTGDTDKKWPGWPGTSVFRLLVPSQKIGGIIGRKGEFIKKMCEESRSRIKILDGPPGIPERAVMISAKEEQEASIPPAMDGLLRVHKRLIDGLDGEHGHIPPAGAVITTRLLVAGSQAGNLIGKQGSIIKSIQEESNTVVRILGTESLPPVALQDDRIVEIQGDGIGVHKALELIASHLRKFLVDHSVLPLFEMHMSMTNPQLEPNVQPWVNPHVPPNAGVPGFGGNPSYIPPRQHDNYYPPAEFPSLNKQHHQGVSMFGRDAPPPMGIHSSANAQPPPPVITQVTQHMQVPLSCADAVIGTAGANISYIRRASGATVTIQETRGIPGEMTVEINGTATQVQTAQQLIQNFIAEASSTTQTQPPSADPGYSSYPSHGSMYTSPPATATHSSHPSGAYGSVYGSSYGY